MELWEVDQLEQDEVDVHVVQSKRQKLKLSRIKLLSFSTIILKTKIIFLQLNHLKELPSQNSD